MRPRNRGERRGRRSAPHLEASEKSTRFVLPDSPSRLLSPSQQRIHARTTPTSLLAESRPPACFTSPVTRRANGRQRAPQLSSSCTCSHFARSLMRSLQATAHPRAQYTRAGIPNQAEGCSVDHSFIELSSYSGRPNLASSTLSSRRIGPSLARLHKEAAGKLF